MLSQRSSLHRPATRLRERYCPPLPQTEVCSPLAETFIAVEFLDTVHFQKLNTKEITDEADHDLSLARYCCGIHRVRRRREQTGERCGEQAFERCRDASSL